MDNVRSEKGFTYIIIVTIIIVFISMLFILFKPIKNTNNLSKLADNYKIELEELSKSDINISEINKFNSSFVDYIQSHNYNVEICNIIDDSNQNIYVSNYLGKECDLYVNSDLNQSLSDKETVKIDRFINNMNIYLCNCNLYYSQNNKITYYINIYNKKTKIINKN